jgi:NAD(P)-dependent dehydrogenase (short-subunit alcohol dehydrogenase family)
LRLDVTDAAHIQRAVDAVESLDILINNAGVANHDDLTDPSDLERHLAVNLFGTYVVIRAFLPLLTQSLRAILAPRGVRFHAVLTGPVDTDMIRGLDIPKASPVSSSLAEQWYRGPTKGLERQFATLLAAAAPATSEAPA